MGCPRDFRDSPESKFLFPFSIWFWAWTRACQYLTNLLWKAFNSNCVDLKITHLELDNWTYIKYIIRHEASCSGWECYTNSDNRNWHYFVLSLFRSYTWERRHVSLSLGLLLSDWLWPLKLRHTQWRHCSGLEAVITELWSLQANIGKNYENFLGHNTIQKLAIIFDNIWPMDPWEISAARGVRGCDQGPGGHIWELLQQLQHDTAPLDTGRD